MDTLLQDFRYAVRQLLRSPGFTAAAVLTLALGIGANTAIFSVVDAVLLRPLRGVENPERLVGITPGGIPHPVYRDLQDQNQALSGLAAFRLRTMSLGSGDRPELVSGGIVSGNYFSVVGARPVLGRSINPDDDAGAQPVSMLSHELWKRSFGSAPDVVGKTVVLNGRTFTIVGVASPEFSGTALFSEPAIWIPIGAWPFVATGSLDGLDIHNRGWGWLSLVGRLKPGIDLQQAQADLNALVRSQRELYPDEIPDGFSLAVHPASVAAAGAEMHGGLVLFSSLLFAAVGLVLLIACANVAGLLLARAAKRRKEIGIRMSLGASRGRVIRQLLSESLVLSLVAGTLGMVVAVWTMEFLASFAPTGAMPMDLPDVGLNPRVLGFALALSVATGVVFSLVPALHASRPDLVPALKDQTSAPGRGTSRLRSALVGAQVALSLLLLICAGLFARTLQKATTVDLGFDPENIALASVNLGLQRYSASRAQQFQRDAVERVKRLPGVQSAGWATDVPLNWEENQEVISVPGYQPRPDEEMAVALRAVGAGYFNTLRIPLVRGREFMDQDAPGAPGVVVINEAMARKYWPNADPVGKRITFSSDPDAERTVIGVAKNSKQHSVGEEPEPFAYLPLSQKMESWGLSGTTLIVRTDGDPKQLLRALSGEIRSLDPNLPVSGLETLREHLGAVLLPQRAGAKLLGLFGLLALVLAAVGIYGVVAYSAAQRTHEIGIRMALGARRRDALLIVLKWSLVSVAVGTALGLIAAFAATRVLSSFLYEISPTDPVAFLGAAALLGAIALFASYLPARHAARVDPMIALRAE